MLKVVVGPPHGYVEGEILSRRKGGKKVVVISSERGFNPLELARVAKMSSMDPKFVLGGVYVSRAFNIFQAERLITELGPEKAHSIGASLLIAVDIHLLFTAGGSLEENVNRFRNCIRKLKRRAPNLNSEFVFNTMIDSSSPLIREASLQADDVVVFDRAKGSSGTSISGRLPIRGDSLGSLLVPYIDFEIRYYRILE